VILWLVVVQEFVGHHQHVTEFRKGGCGAAAFLTLLVQKSDRLLRFRSIGFVGKGDQEGVFDQRLSSCIWMGIQETLGHPAGLSSCEVTVEQGQRLRRNGGLFSLLT